MFTGFPEWRRIIPEDHDLEFTCDGEEFYKKAKKIDAMFPADAWARMLVMNVNGRLEMSGYVRNNDNQDADKPCASAVQDCDLGRIVPYMASSPPALAPLRVNASLMLAYFSSHKRRGRLIVQTHKTGRKPLSFQFEGQESERYYLMPLRPPEEKTPESEE